MIDARGDDAQRLRALDVGRSFLVQAPAGSGKTELLIQRFLALLPTVDEPEAIVAMTFTRKAAGEMRERIVGALRDASELRPVASPHGERTRELALAALRHDAAKGWNLIAHPARLRLLTIDALAAGLARAAPLTAHAGGMPELTEHAEALYRTAAGEALAQARSDDPAWRSLLDYLDNDAARAVELLAALLAKREQWLRRLVHVDRASLRAALETTLGREVELRLEGARALVPAHALPRLAALARHALAHVSAAGQESALARALERCADSGVPGVDCSELAHWDALARWLLLASGPAWRSQFTRAHGFPPGAAGSLQRRRKDDITALVGELARVPGLAEALDGLRRLPPVRYDDAAWEVVAALLALLPQVAAMLKVVFARERTIDFSEATELALLALGTPEAPSEVLLALDQRIAHLLIDEFQDTSLVQRELMLHLTAGWSDGDGRTLFAVGDPMQSIYRFREAEVRLFLEAQQQEKLGDLALEPLALSRNFRSHAGIVEWVNRVFPSVLEPADDPACGAVRFKPSLAVRPSPDAPSITFDLATTEGGEAVHVVARLREALGATPSGSVAVLVRARVHLRTILPALRDAGIAFHAVELDRLIERPAIRDLLALTHALLQPVDRLAWLAVLRAPWCGLGLPDLVAVAESAKTIWPDIAENDSIPGLSSDGRARMARLIRIVQATLAQRRRRPLPLLLRGAWLALGGPATLNEPSDLEAAERYFALLADHAVAGDVPDWTRFVGALEGLYAQPEPGPGTRVHVMTLHKAKGLEFDTVVLAGLAHAPPNPAPDLLRWRLRPTGLVLAPMRARAAKREDPVYAYLAELAAEEERVEAGRLLYVGATRAKRSLHLTAWLPIEMQPTGTVVWTEPPAKSLLARLWPALQRPPVPDAARGATPVEPHPRGGNRLARLPASWQAPPPAMPVSPPKTSARAQELPIAFDWARETARHVGTVAHRFMAHLAGAGTSVWSVERVTALLPRIRVSLLDAGVDGAELDAAAAVVRDVLLRVAADSRGRWLFDPGHADARSEWALAGIDGDALVHVSIDRTFVCDGERWIVDFKTGAHEGADVDAFLDRERTRYAPQLERYARIVRRLDRRPIRLALYHPLQGGWREWRFSEPAANAPVAAQLSLPF